MILMPSVISRLAGRRSRPDSSTLLPIGLGLVGFFLILAFEATYGVVLNWDSANYIHVARGLLSGDGFVQVHTTAPYDKWPPLYPILLAVASLLVFDPRDVAGHLNAAVFGAMIFTVGMHLRRRVESRFLIIWGCLAVMLSWPLVNMVAQAMPESVFILFVTVALILMDKFMERGDKGSLLVWVAVFSAAALLTRYLGIALVVLILVILLFQRGAAVREKLKNAVVYALVAMAPICVWMVRNYVVSGEFTGIRDTYEHYSLFEVLSGTWTVVRGWLPLSDSWIISGVAVVTGAALIVYVTIARLGTSDAEWPGRRSFHLFGGFAITYTLVLVVAMMLGNTSDGVQPRFIVPVYIPLVLVLVFALDLLFRDANHKNLLGSTGSVTAVRSIASRWGGRRPKSVLVLILMISCSAWTVYGGVMIAGRIARANSDIGTGYFNNARWADSEVLRYFRENSIDEIVISNAPLAFQTHIDVSSHYLYLFQPDLDDLIEKFEIDLDGAYLVWFHDKDISARYDYGLPQLRVLHGLELVADLDDGVIFRVNPSYAGVAEEYRALHASLVSGDALVIRSEFDVYLGEGQLHYVKDSCVSSDTESPFFLHVYPADVSDFVDVQKVVGFDNLNWDFLRYGVMLDGKCLASVGLPMHAISRIDTGQFIPGGSDVWKVTHSTATTEALHVFDELRSDGVEVAARSVFDVYIHDSRLVYAKSSCTDDDRDTRFFLHIRPAYMADLPAERRSLGFDNLDFDLWEHGGESDRACFAVVDLPEYRIASISTGQYTRGDGDVWRVNHSMATSDALSVFQQLRGDGVEPAVRSVFDVYIHDSRLVYAKSSCTEKDRDTRFFLHVKPVDVSDLSEKRRESGFDNLDFNLWERGGESDGACFAVVDLPDYDIARISTGQFTSDGRVWSEGLEFGSE